VHDLPFKKDIGADIEGHRPYWPFKFAVVRAPDAAKFGHRKAVREGRGNATPILSQYSSRASEEDAPLIEEVIF
jgi:hypothetical protein